MYKRYYDSYRSCNCACADSGEVITPKCTNDTYPQKSSNAPMLLNECNDKFEDKCPPCNANEDCEKKSLFSLPCELDDLILIGILILLLKDNDSIDPIIPIIIGFVLLTDGF